MATGIAEKPALRKACVRNTTFSASVPEFVLYTSAMDLPLNPLYCMGIDVVA